MEVKLIIEMASGLIGGLFIFLLGMRYMSDGMQAVAGNSLRRMIAKVTDNRVAACGTGTIVTCLLQSSSVTAVMAVTMVNAGLMTLQQSIGVILGADLGTTITAWIVAIKITKFGLPILGLSGFVYLFAKQERTRQVAMTVMGLGMIFFGLMVMKGGMDPLSTMPEFEEAFSRFTPDTYWGLLKCVLVGSIATAVMQSSSATIALTITLANTGMLSFETAVALVLGQNIGTTITAWLAALGASTAAKRTAYAHILIKILGVLIVIPFFYVYLDILDAMMPAALMNNIGLQIAFSHTLFNVFIVLTFLPLTGVLVLFLTRLIPKRHDQEMPHLTYLDIGPAATPAIAIQESATEILTMRDSVATMMAHLQSEFEKPGQDKQARKSLFHLEEVIDLQQKEVVQFISHLLRRDVSAEMVEESRRQLRVSDEYESISDYIVVVQKQQDRIVSLEVALDSDIQEEREILHNKVTAYLAMIGEALATQNVDVMAPARTDGQSITRHAKRMRTRLFDEIHANHEFAVPAMVLVDMIHSYRKIQSHAMNIAEAIAGEK
jgi:phosphate:Na+ symporter